MCVSGGLEILVFRKILLTYLMDDPFLNMIKQPENISLQVSTNDAVIHDSGEIVKDLLNLKGLIQEKTPNCKIILYDTAHRFRQVFENN